MLLAIMIIYLYLTKKWVGSKRGSNRSGETCRKANEPSAKTPEHASARMPRISSASGKANQEVEV